MLPYRGNKIPEEENYCQIYLSRAVHSRIAVMMPLLCPSTTATVPSCLHAYPFCKGRTINCSKVLSVLSDQYKMGRHLTQFTRKAPVLYSSTTHHVHFQSPGKFQNRPRCWQLTLHVPSERP